MAPTVDEPSGSATAAPAIEDAEGLRGALSPYQMHIIREPPVQVRPGNALIPAVRVALRTQETHEDEGARGRDLSSYWASVSLISADGLVALAPPSTTILSGSLVDSIREPESAEGERDIGYVLFRNLVINQPGYFRLRISLLRMPSGTSDAETTGGGLLPSSSGVLNTGSVTTRIIHVHRDAPTTA
ncbi:MAG: hypothetical protein Q9207_007757 [Kuettlingeria erythrocarpa]